jgi:hypothetical protein
VHGNVTLPRDQRAAILVQPAVAAIIRGVVSAVKFITLQD